MRTGSDRLRRNPHLDDTDGYDDPRSGSSHHCPKSRQGAVANDVKIERIGTPHMTVSQQVEQVTMRHSHCNDVEIERIGTPHTTVSQQAVQINIDTGQWAMQKDERSRRNIVCRWSENWTRLHVESEITITILNHQSITISIRRSKLHCYRATMAIDIQYDGEVVDGVTKFPRREKAMSTWSSPTDKSKAHLEAVCRDTHRQVYQDVLPTNKSTPRAKSTKSTRWSLSGLPQTITESTPLTDDYRLHYLFYRACGSTAQSSDSARALELGKYNHLDKLTC